jgi:uncharacterized repeat protein (TIGR03803 family)
MKTLLVSYWIGLLLAPTLFAIGEVKPELLHAFSAGVSDFSQGVVPGPDGNFYGVSQSGGRFGGGTLFRIAPPVSTGTGTVTILIHFGDPASTAPGVAPIGRLAFDGVDKFYGVTQAGGAAGAGTIFRTALDGTVETLVEFTGFDGAAIGGSPSAGLVLAGDGNFYGTAANGGPADGGTIFRLSKQGGFKTLLIFSGRAGKVPGATPLTPLLLLTDGSLVGTTFAGGKANLGTIFRLKTDGTFTRLATFTGAAGALPGLNPVGHLVQGLDGTVYGLSGGRVQGGVSEPIIWRLPSSGPVTQLLQFSTASNGESVSVPATGLALLSSGNLLVNLESVSNGDYGGLFEVTPAGVVNQLSLFDSLAPPVLNFYTDSGPVSDGAGGFIGPIFGALYRTNANAVPQLFALPTPDNGTGVGARPDSQVVFATDGTLYGFCADGGDNFNGTIFKFPAAGPVGLLAPLPTGVFRDERHPIAYDAVSNSILLTQSRGGSEGKGRILKIDSSGVVSTRADFVESPSPADTPARFPTAGVTVDASGNLYGLAQHSGTTGDEEPTLYRLPISGSLERVAVLGLGQTSVEGGLARDGSGNLVGALPSGGGNGMGALFRVTPAGVVTKLAEFGGAANLAASVHPHAPLLPGAGGSFLFAADPSDNSAATNILRLTAAGVVESVASLTFDTVLGGFLPTAPLESDSAGRTYVALSRDGLTGGGVLVRVETNGSFQVAYKFQNSTAIDAVGYEPTASLRLGPDSYLYGVTSRGGPSGGGTLFRIPTTTTASGNSLAASDVAANSVTLNATLTSNSFGGQYWFTFGEQGGPLDQETEHLSFTGFSGPQSFSQAVSGFKGHRTYAFQLHSVVGFGSDAVTITGTTLSFAAPNGKPQPQTDAIVATSLADPFVGDVLANDTDPDGDTLTIGNYSQGTFGSVALDAGQFTYTPGLNFVDRDSFTYTVSDGLGETATATVNVLLTTAVSGEYTGVLYDEEPAPSAASPLVELASPGERLAAGLARLSVTRRGRLSARFDIGARTVSLSGQLAAARDTTISGDRSQLLGTIRPVPAGFEGRITYNGRTLILRAGQGFFAAGQSRQPSAFTVRLTPTDVANPILGDGLPAGSGYVLIRQAKTARATLVGVLPDGTAFSRASVVDSDGRLPFFSMPYARKTGLVGGALLISAGNDVDAAPDGEVRWQKPLRAKETRFPAGFSTGLTPFGGKYTPGRIPLNAPTGAKLSLDLTRGSLFAPAQTQFTISGNRARPDPANNGAKATLSFSAAAGLFSGTFRSDTGTMKFRGAIIQRDNQGIGFFLNRYDAGSALLSVIP